MSTDDESPLPPVIPNPVFIENVDVSVNDAAPAVETTTDTPVDPVPVVPAPVVTPTVVASFPSPIPIIPISPPVVVVSPTPVQAIVNNVTNAATTVSTVAANTAATVSNAITTSSISTVSKDASTLTNAFVSDVSTVSHDIVSVSNVVSHTAKELYKSPLSTILTICGRSLLKDTSINSSNILLVAHDVMESIETLKTLQVMKDMTSEQKKQLALDCLHWLVNNDDNLTPDEKVVINILVTTVVPNTVDMMIAISNGQSELVSKGAKCVGTVSKCCIIS